MKQSSEAEAHKIWENFVPAILLTENGYPEYMQPPLNNKQSRKQTTQLKKWMWNIKKNFSAFTASGECKLKQLWDFM